MLNKKEALAAKCAEEGTIPKLNKTEQILAYQQTRIDEILEKNKGQDVDISFNVDKVIILNKKNENNNDAWDNAVFDKVDTYTSEDDVVPNISHLNWNNEPLDSFKANGIEISNKVLKSRDTYKMLKGLGVELKVQFSLIAASSFWVILRTTKEYSAFSVVIIISKHEKSQNTFLSMGTFIPDQSEKKDRQGAKLSLKIFKREQICIFGKDKKKENINSDRIDYTLIVNDKGDNSVVCRVLPNSEVELRQTTMTFNHFLPYYDNSPIIVAGHGESCIVRNAVSKSYSTRENDLSGNKRNDCCSIF